MHPNETAIQLHNAAQHTIRDHSSFILNATRAFGVAGIMDVAQNSQPDHLVSVPATLSPVGQHDAKCSPLAGMAFHSNASVMLLNDPLRHRQSQARTVWFGGKERFEKV